MERAPTITSQTILYNQTINTTATPINPKFGKSKTIFLEKIHQSDQIILPLDTQRDRVFELEKQLFESINLEWDVDIITEDIPVIENGVNDYYMHLVRTAHPDPNKENFLLIHGFLSSSLHFMGILPYLIKRYNVFIPDTIGMGLSSRPQIKFTSPIQCESYFMDVYHLFIKILFFITDYRIPGTEFFSDSSKRFFCSSICFPTCVWPCQLRVQSLYNCCLCHNMIKNHYGIKNLKLYTEEIKRNPDGSEFKVDYNKLKTAINELTIISLDYPRDLYKCAYYMFTPNPPAAIYPVEQKIRDFNKLQVIICFGEYDWMDKIGSYRLQKFNPDRYKVYTISKGGHSFSYENPKELCSIIEQYFNE